MEKLFGLPVSDLLVGLTATLLVGLALMAITAWRNRVLFSIGVRNIARRPAQTILIVLGLMLATLLVSAALVTGDTVSHSIQTSALEGLGKTDLIIETKKAEGPGPAPGGARAGNEYIQPDIFKKVKETLKKTDKVDGVAAVLPETVPAAAPESRLNLPGLQLLGVQNSYDKSFGPLEKEDGGKLSVKALEPGRVYLNLEAADKLEVKKGGRVDLFTKSGPQSFTVAGVFAVGGRPSTGPALVMRLAEAQELLGAGDGFSAILISGDGDELEGVTETKAIQKRLRPVLDSKLFTVNPVKQDALDEAKEASGMFTSIFLIFGQFSMMAGVMLIFLIFVMLAAERKTELGVMRALGSQKRDLLKIFLFEGTVYAALAAIVGTLTGIGVGWVMVKIMAGAFSSADNFTLSFHYYPRSAVIAYAIGVISTFIIVTLSAWRAGRVNIVRAIRDLPEPLKVGRSLKWLFFLVLLLIAGGLATMGGYNAEQRGLFGMGLSLIIIAVPLLARWLRLPDRAAFSIAGLGLIGIWLLPESTLISLLPEYEAFNGGIELFFISGTAIVAGAVWTVMYNSDILLSVVTAVFSRLRGWPPMLRIAVNYPMQNRMRTGLALAMFSLIVFTLVFMSALLNSLNSIYSDIDGLSGGYDVRGVTGYVNPITAIEEGAGDFAAVGSFAGAPVEIRQKGSKKKDWTDYRLQGIDPGYASDVNYEFQMRSSEYGSDREVWQALLDRPDVAVVHAGLVPAKVSFNVGGNPDQFRLSGFFKEDEKLPETYIETKNAAGEITKLRVIGVVSEMSLYVFNSIITSQETLNEIAGAPVPPTVFWFKLKPEADVEKSAKSLAKRFYENGMETESLAEDIRGNMQANMMMNRLLQGFMGLGLIVGIAALGVIAARSVVERRRQIGMLRAIGFHRRMVQNTFFLESSFVALLGVGIGSILGLTLSSNVTDFMAKDMPGLVYEVPWLDVIAIAVLAYAASLLTTYLPARQAAKIYPAEALRYE